MDDNVAAAEVADYNAYLPELIAVVEESISQTDKARKMGAEHRRFYDDYPWSSAELLAFQKRGQPDVSLNLVKPAVNAIAGVARSQQVDPRALPRNANDEESAEIATKTLRYISDINRFDTVTRADGLEGAVIEFAGAVYAGFSQEDDEVDVSLIRPEELIYDGASRTYDFSDARYMGTHKWVWLDDLVSAFPNSADQIRVSSGSALSGVTEMEDRPRFQWSESAGKRLSVVELYRRKQGQWERSLFVRGAVLEHGPSPYVDKKGRPTNPIIAFSIYIDGDNNRYGPTKDMIAPQREANKRRQKLLHMANSRQLEVDPNPDVMVDVHADIARQEAGRPDGVIPRGYRVVQMNDMAQFQSQLLADARQHIDRITPAPAVLGRQDSGQSGRAIMARQQAGMMELAPVFSRLNDWTLRVYRAMWERARQFYTEPKMIRITDDLKAVQMLQVNEPITENVPQMAQGAYGPMTVMAPQVVGYKNRLSDMDMDIIIDATPDTATLQEEQFAILADLASKGMPIPPDAIIRASSLPNKRDLLESLKQGQGQPNPAQEAEAGKVQAEAKKAEAEAGYKQAQTQQITQLLPMNAMDGFQGMMPPPGNLGDSPMATVLN